MNVQSFHRMNHLSDKQKAIFDSTLTLIRDHGFHGTTMNLVAKKAGVAAGTIYHYFESKDELISELYKHNRKLTVEVINNSLNEQHTFKENFYNLWATLYQFYIDNTNILIFFEQYVNSPYKADKNNAYSHSRLLTFFENGMVNGHIKQMNPKLALILTVSNIATAAKLHKFGNINMENHSTQQIRDIFWNGITVIE